MLLFPIIGFSGKLGVGKSYLAKILFGMSKKSIILNFADVPKLSCIFSGIVTFENSFVEKTFESRSLIKKYCTDMREKHGKDVFIRQLEKVIKVIRFSMGDDVQIIIADIRFPEEIDFVQSQGGIVIRVDAPNRNHDALMKESLGNEQKYLEIATHPSEIALDNYGFEFDMRINNDDNSDPKSIFSMFF